MFRHQAAIIRDFLRNEVLWVQQVFHALFAHISIIEDKTLKMSKFKSHTHIAASPISHGDKPPVPHIYSRFVTWAVLTDSRNNVSSKKMPNWNLWFNPIRVYSEPQAHVFALKRTFQHNTKRVRRGVCVGSWWGNRKERDHWGDLGLDGWIILGWISRRWDVGMDWIGLAQDRDSWRTLVSAVMNLRVPWNAGNFLPSCKTVSFWRRTLHLGVSKFVWTWYTILKYENLKNNYNITNQNTKCLYELQNFGLVY